MSPPAERRVGEKWREDERELIRKYKDALRKRDSSPLEPTNAEPAWAKGRSEAKAAVSR